jgi:hypothetical protein
MYITNMHSIHSNYSPVEVSDYSAHSCSEVARSTSAAKPKNELVLLSGFPAIPRVM